MKKVLMGTFLLVLIGLLGAVNAHTRDITTFPYNEGFNVSVPPTDWTATTVADPDTDPTLTMVASGSYPTCTTQEGSGMVKFNSFNCSAGAEMRLATPLIHLNGVASPAASFWMVHENYTSYSTGAYLLEGVQPQISTNGTDWTNLDSFYPRHDGSLSTPTWAQHSVDLSAYTGQTVYLGLLFHSSFGDNIYVDNLSIQSALLVPPGPPSGPSPASGATNVAIDLSQLTWDNGSNTSTFDLYLGTTNPPTTMVANNLSNPGTWTIPAATLSNSSTYYWYVVARNDNGTTSGPVWSFTTVVGPVTTFPYNESFDVSVPPAFWTTTIVADAGTDPALTLATSGGNPSCSPQQGTGMVRFNSYNCDAGGEIRLATPPMQLSGMTAPVVDFWMLHNYNTSYSTGVYLLEGVQVQVSVNGTDWTSVGDFFPRHDGSLTTPTWAEHMVNLTAYAGQTVFVGLLFHSSYGDNIFVDNFNMFNNQTTTPPNPAVSPRPADLATQIALDTTFGWASGGNLPSGYYFNLGTNNPPTNLINNEQLTGSTHAAVTGLNYATTYYWQVVPFNDGGNASNCPVWSFTTVPNPNYGQVGSYYFANSTDAATPSPSRPSFDWIDISTTGTEVTSLIDDDETIGPYDIGSDFTYYGQTYTQFYICSNGWVALGSTAPGTTAYSNVAIPTVSVPNNAIYGYWDDLRVDYALPADKHLYYGHDANDNLVISWVNMPVVGTSAETNCISFQIVLCPTTNRVKIQYLNAGSTTVLNSATIGIENADGTEAVQYQLNGTGATAFNNDEPIAVAFATDATLLGDGTGTAGTISGTVTAVNGGAPVPNCRVSFNSRTRTTDASGQYTFNNVQPGTYTVSFYAVGYNEASLNNVVVTSNNTTTANMALQAFNGNLPAPTALTGSFTAANTAVLNWTAPAPVRQTRTQRTVLQGYNVYRAGTLLNATVIAANTTTYTDNTVVAGANAYTVRAVYDQGTSVDSAVLNLNYASGTLTGVVYSGLDNQPFAGASITAGWWTATSDADGAYTINDILEGTYTINASGAGQISVTVPNVVIAAGQTTTQNITLGNPNWGSQGGYYYANSYPSSTNAPSQPAYEWVDISSTGTDVRSDLDDDAITTSIPIGFDFTYFGQTYNHVYICSNGWITLDDGSSEENAWTNETIPTEDLPNGIIAPYWDDLDCSYTNQEDSHVWYGNDEEGNFVITYNNIPYHGSDVADNHITFQVIFYHENNRVKFQYQSITSTFITGHGNSATIGLENMDGTIGCQYRYNTEGGEFLAADGDPMAVAFATDPLDVGDGPRIRGNIEGTVTAATGGAAINGATVTCGSRRATTDNTGHYLLQNLAAGEATVTVYAVGYNQTTATCTVVQDQTVTCNISMPTFTGTLPAPTSLVGNLVSGHEVALTWTAPPAPTRTSLLQSRSLNVRNTRTVFDGYRVYRNNVLITPTLLTVPQYNDTTPGGGDQVYFVTAVYDQGESAHSNSVTVSVVPGTLSGTITSTVTGLPIAGASCNVNDNIATTNAQGVYSLLLPVDTNYTMHVTATGYIAGQVANLSISPNQTTTANLSLADDTASYTAPAVPTYEVNGTSITLNWTALAEGPHAVQNYKVYREATLIATVPATQLTYTDSDLANGTYHYTLTAVYPGGESAHSGTATVIIFVFTPIAPTNLSGSLENHIVNLTWESPLADRTLQWGGNTCPGGVGTNAATDFDVAQRFDSSDIAGMNGRYITSVSFFPRYASCEYSIRIWQGGNINSTPVAPGTLLVDQLVTNVTVGQWNTVQITEPPAINETQELWIGYRCNTQGGMPAGRDAGPAINWKGNLMYFQGTWTTLSAISSTSNYNWCLSAVVSASPVTRDLNGYNIYRNSTLVGTVENPSTLTYSEVLNDSGTFNYYVTSIFDEGESVASNIVTFTGANNNVVNADVTSLVGNYPNPFNPTTYIKFNLAQPGHVKLNVYNSRGQKVRSLVNNNMNNGLQNIMWDGKDDAGNTLSSGIYMYKLECGRYTSTKKMVLMK